MRELAGLRNPFKTLIVTGIPGVGKTTVLGHVARKLESKKSLVVNFGDYMFRVAERRGLVNTRDEIRRIGHRQQLELQKAAAQLIIQEATNHLGEEGVLLVDTHAIVKTSSGYWPGLPKHVVETLKPDSIVIIEADPEQIIARQSRDATRNRKDLSDLNIIKELAEMARKAAISSATLTASSVYIVTNPPGKPEAAAQQIISLINKL